MEKIKRYFFRADRGDIITHDHGEWVRYEDLERIVKELKLDRRDVMHALEEIPEEFAVCHKTLQSIADDIMELQAPDIAHLLEPREFDPPPKQGSTEGYDSYIGRLVQWLVRNEVRKFQLTQATQKTGGSGE